LRLYKVALFGITKTVATKLNTYKIITFLEIKK
jgi:hypothetical protein